MPSKTSTAKVHRCKAIKRSSGRFTGVDLEKLTNYWESRLKRMGLTMEAGRKIGSEVITYGHMISALDWDGRITYRPPTGERLDADEWPLSLC